MILIKKETEMKIYSSNIWVFLNESPSLSKVLYRIWLHNADDAFNQNDKQILECISVLCGLSYIDQEIHML